MQRTWKSISFGFVLAVVTLLASIGALYAFETIVEATDPEARDFWWKYPREPLPISTYSVATLSGDPISSVHPNLDYKGIAPWETRGRVPESRVFHVRSNRFGFYTDHPVDEYPAKHEREFRIILVGGSGAQGHGGSSNDRMMYKIVERQLTESLSDTGFRVNVINLALAGGEARANAGVLRTFGHRLDPDMILAYSGANDIVQFPRSYSSTYCNAYFETFVRSTFVGPKWMNELGKHFPVLLYRYGLARTIKRRFYAETYRDLAVKRCLRDLGIDTTRGRLATALYRDGSARAFVANFKAIKRDFCGIPIMVAWQALHDGERKLYNQWLSEFDPQTNPIATLASQSQSETRIEFHNPEQRVVYFAASRSSAAKPRWDEVVRSGKAYDQVGGFVDVSSASLTIDRISARTAEVASDEPAAHVFYAMEPTSSDDRKEVYRVYSESELNGFRHQHGIYQRFIAHNVTALSGYMNRYWYFLNVDQRANSVDPATVPDMRPASIAVHLDDVGQKIVADVITEYLAPVVRDLIRDERRSGCSS